MPGVVHGGETFTISPGGTLLLTTTWSPGPNQGPVFVMGDPVSGQEVPAILITFDYSKCRHAPTGGQGGPGTHEVFYQWKVRSESTQAVSFKPEFFDPT